MFFKRLIIVQLEGMEGFHRWDDNHDGFLMGYNAKLKQNVHMFESGNKA